MSKRSCDYCEGARALVIGETDDIGIAIKFPYYLIAYGYDIHGPNANVIYTQINYCPMCGRKLKSGKK